jgi:hypothetical protein
MDTHMSQYPPGYPSPLGYPPAPMGDPLAPAKRASLMMIILGCLSLIMGLCAGLAVVMFSGQMQSQLIKQLPPEVSMPQLILAAKVGAVMFVAVALAEIILGVLVRGGRSVPIIVSMVLTVVGILYYLVSMALSFRTGILPGPLVVFVIAIVLGGIQLMLLISAQRASVHVSGMQAAYQQGTAAPPGYGGTPVYGANAYNAPPPGAAGTATAQSGWQWTGQPTSPPIPPPIPLPPPPNDVDHDQQA